MAASRFGKPGPNLEDSERPSEHGHDGLSRGRQTICAGLRYMFCFCLGAACMGYVQLQELPAQCKGSGTASSQVQVLLSALSTPAAEVQESASTTAVAQTSGASLVPTTLSESAQTFTERARVPQVSLTTATATAQGSAAEGEAASPASHPFLCRPLEQPWFVINLEGPRGQKRRDHATREMLKAGIKNFSFWPAADAGDNSPGGMCERERKRFPRNAGVKHWRHNNGCYKNPSLANSLSHRLIYEHIVDNKLPCAVIFEDDFSLCDNFLEDFKRVTETLPPFDVIQLGYCPHGGKPSTPQVCGSNVKKKLVLKYGWPGACAHAYILSYQGALFFGETHKPVRVPADGAWSPMHMKGHPAERTSLDKSPGALPGSYWHTYPMLSYQGYDIAEGGAPTSWQEFVDPATNAKKPHG